MHTHILFSIIPLRNSWFMCLLVWTHTCNWAYQVTFSTASMLYSAASAPFTDSYTTITKRLVSPLQPPPPSLFAGVLLLRNILAHRWPTPPTYHQEPKPTPALTPPPPPPPWGAKANTQCLNNITEFSFWLSKFDWVTLGDCAKMKSWANRVKFHNISPHFNPKTRRNAERGWTRPRVEI